MNKYLISCITLVVVAGMFFLGRCTSEKEIQYVTKVEKDTTEKIIEKPADPLELNKAKAKIVYIKEIDTLIVTKPFVASVDTIIRKDTVFVSYNLLDNTFDFHLKPHPDSLRIQTITITTEKLKETPWWETTLYALSGFAVGAIAGKIVK